MRKLVIVLSVIFYAASLLVVMTSLNQVAAKEASGASLARAGICLPPHRSGESPRLGGIARIPGSAFETDSTSR